jgi:hypothetical protein
MESRVEMKVCSICNERIREGEGYTSFSFHYVEEDDPLWPFRESVMHNQCFNTWGLKSRYIEKFNENVAPMYFGGVSYYMNEDGHVERIERRTES